MVFTLKTGGNLELPDLPSVDKAIDEFEDELARLRRLRKVVAEMTGAPVKKETPKTATNGAAATPAPAPAPTA